MQLHDLAVTLPSDYNAAAHFIDRHVTEGRGERLAYLDFRGPHSYADLAARSARAGHALRRLGVQPEQRVLLCLLDTFDFPAVFFGALKIGAIPVPVNTLLTAADYEFLLRDSRARAVVVSDVLLPRLRPALLRAPAVLGVLVAASPDGDGAGDGVGVGSGSGVGVGVGGRADAAVSSLDVALSQAPAELDNAPTCRDEPAFWLYSSGSTGAPKAAVHLHGNLVQTAILYGERLLGVRPDDLIFSAAKLFFAYGLGNALTFPLHMGAAAVLLAERPTPEAVLATLRRHRPSLFCGVPTLFAALLEKPTLAADASALRCSTSAGEALPAAVGRGWREVVGTDILDGIGSTEMLHIFLSNRIGEVRYGTTGRAVPGYQLRLSDDSGDPVPDGEEGSLWVRGPSSCAHYWNDRERSLKTFHGAWTRTGDRYVRDEDGYYIYAGRADDMLKVGGIWVSPVEVEAALCEHPAVREAAVVGQADAAGLVKPRAYVVLRGGHRGDEAQGVELQEFVKGRLAPYKYPRWIEFVDELPRTATGKLQRYRLRG